MAPMIARFGRAFNAGGWGGAVQEYFRPGRCIRVKSGIGVGWSEAAAP
jgi:hypothetical protein